jgi:hypothetical protein
MEPDLALKVAVDNLYVTFEPYPLHPDTGPCSCCHNPIDEQKLHGKPLRNLTIKDLEKYAFDALLTWGDVKDFKHFLPRIFELAVLHHDTDTFVDPEVICGKLRYGDWRSWPEPEQQSIDNFLQILWSSLLKSNLNLFAAGLLKTGFVVLLKPVIRQPHIYTRCLLSRQTTNASISQLSSLILILRTQFLQMAIGMR